MEKFRSEPVQFDYLGLSADKKTSAVMNITTAKEQKSQIARVVGVNVSYSYYINWLMYQYVKGVL